jgi:hypothetical protein
MEELYRDRFSFPLKNGKRAIATVEQYEYVRPPQYTAYEILVTVDNKRVGDFTLGIYEEDTKLVAQMDAKVRKPYRRLGIASAVYAFADKLAARYGTTIKPAPDGSDDAKNFWLSRSPIKSNV